MDIRETQGSKKVNC